MTINYYFMRSRTVVREHTDLSLIAHQRVCSKRLGIIINHSALPCKQSRLRAGLQGRQKTMAAQPCVSPECRLLLPAPQHPSVDISTNARKSEKTLNFCFSALVFQCAMPRKVLHSCFHTTVCKDNNLCLACTVRQSVVTSVFGNFFRTFSKVLTSHLHLRMRGFFCSFPVVSGAR